MTVDKEIIRAAIPIEEYYREHLGQPVKTSGKYWTHFCKFHNDKKTPNLTVYFDGGYRCEACGEKGGDVFAFHRKLTGLSFFDVLKYFAGRYIPHLLPSNGNGKQSKKIVATYDYLDETRKLLFQVVKKEPKDFLFRRPDSEGGWIWNLHGVQRVPYRLPELVASTGPVYIPGGEKDCETLINLGMTATTNPCGEGKWKPEFNEHLNGREVVVFEDNDEPGQEHGKVVAQSLHGIAEAVKIISFPELPEHGDVSDYLQSHTKEDLFQRIKDAPFYEPVKEECKIIQFPGPADGAGVNEFMVSAGISALSENSGPDEIIEAISKFLAIIGNKDVVWLGIAKSELIKKLGGIGVKSPSKMVNDAMKTGKAETVEGQGQAMSFEDPEPWADEVDGVKLFNEITQTCNRFLVLRECGAETITLWAIHAWAIDAAQISPYLILQSPEKRCGKTTTLNLLSELSPNPIPASSISPAALFRSVEKYSPTLLIDEADRALKNSEELNCILNASHVRKSAVTIRTVGQALNNKELRENANGTNAEAVPAEKQPNLFKNNNCPSVPDGNMDMGEKNKNKGFAEEEVL